MNNYQLMQPLHLKSLRTRFTLHFLKALKKIHQNKPQLYSKNGNNNNNPIIIARRRYKKVRLAADTSLASAVGPRQAWARAILVRARCTRRRARCEALGRRRARVVHVRAGLGYGRTRELRRLVPGGEEMDMQSLLDETLDYVKCLTTQVNVMRNIVDLCSK